MAAGLLQERVITTVWRFEVREEVAREWEEGAVTVADVFVEQLWSWWGRHRLSVFEGVKRGMAPCA